MTPPKVQGAPAAADANACDISQINFSVDLTPFQKLPASDKINPAHFEDPFVSNFYSAIKLASEIDSKNGNNDNKLEASEVDAYLKANTEAAKVLGSACNLMGQFTIFSAQAPSLAQQLSKNPEVDLSLFRALPGIDQFPQFENSDLGNLQAIQAKLAASALPDSVKALLSSKEQIFLKYYLAQAYLAADTDGDGKCSLEEATQILAKFNATNTLPGKYLVESRTTAIEMALLGLSLQSQLGLKSSVTLLNIGSLIQLSAVMPDLFGANPDLLAVLQAVVPDDPQTGEALPILATSDGIITLEELKNIPSFQTYCQQNNKSMEEVFTNVQQGLQAITTLPVSFWPESFRKNFIKLSDNTRQFLESAPPKEFQQIDYALRMMENASDTRFQQEQLAHSGGGRAFLNLVTGGRWSKYWVEERPQAHKDTRMQALTTLKEAIRAQMQNGAPPADVMDKAIASLISSGKSGVLDILRSECDFDKIISISKTVSVVDRSKELTRLAEEARAGKHDSFWEAQLVPCPELGSGNYWNRASHLGNWTWLNNPQTIQALSLNNYIATETPNNFDFNNNFDLKLLLAQLPENKRTAFLGLMEKIGKGEEVKEDELRASISDPSLSAEGQNELVTQIQLEMLKFQNQQIFNDPAFQTELQTLSPAQQTDVEQLMGIVLAQSMDSQKPLDSKKLQEVIDKLDSSAHKVAHKLAEVDISFESQIIHAIDEKDLPAPFKRSLYRILPQLKSTGQVKEPVTARVALFREAQLPDPARAEKLFGLTDPTPAEINEFFAMVDSSKLSAENKTTLKAAFLKQPNNYYAEQAEKNFLAILGEPVRDASTGTWKRAEAGSIHTAFRTTINRGIYGYGFAVAPTALFAASGEALFKSFRGISALQKEEITGWSRVFLGRPRNWIGNVRWLRYGTGGFSSRLGPWNPLVGAILVGAAGSVMFHSSRWGEELRARSWNAINYPYLPWSDLAVQDSSIEGINLYINMAGSFQGMDATLGTVKTIGAFEPGTRLARAFGKLELGARAARGIEPFWPEAATFLRGGTGVNTISLEGLGAAFKSAGSALIGKTPAQVAEETLLNLKAGEEVPWYAELQGASAEQVWAKNTYEAALQRLESQQGFWSSNPQFERYLKIQDELASPTLVTAEKSALEVELRELAPQLNKDWLAQYTSLKIRINALKVLGQVGHSPYFASSILERAQKLIEEGASLNKAELVAQGEFLLQNGAVQYIQLPSLGVQNQKMAKFMLWDLFHEKEDEISRPKTPLAPAFPLGIAPGNITDPLNSSANNPNKANPGKGAPAGGKGKAAATKPAH